MLLNKNFYPTPPALAGRMLAKIKGHPGRVLEPSAGKGDLIDALLSRSHYSKPDVAAIEIDPTLQATLRGKKVKVIDSDFLAYAGPDKFDLIFANPPFDEGDKHLLKALDIMYCGQIIFLLNAETLKNPHTNTRQLLARRLDELGAEIEYIQGAFLGAERKTPVEVALVNINISRKIEDDLFTDCDDHGARTYETVIDANEISTGKTIEELVAEYNLAVQTGTEVALVYFKNYRRIGKYMTLNDVVGKDRIYSTGDLTAMMQETINSLLKNVRADYWQRILNLEEVRCRLTEKKRSEFETLLADRCHMDFTERNIRQFVLNLIGSYEQTLTEAVLDIFDMFTVRHSYTGNLHEKNIHYFNGWKTNKAFKVGKRVVVPVRGSYGGPFRSWSGGWSLDYQARQQLHDIDLVFSYFDGGGKHITLPDAIDAAFKSGEPWGESTYFKFKCHQKGTIHLTFKDKDILRRFNVCACRGKGWLPDSYGAKSYAQLDYAERAAADSFEGEREYQKHLGRPLFAASALMIGGAE